MPIGTEAAVNVPTLTVGQEAPVWRSAGEAPDGMALVVYAHPTWHWSMESASATTGLSIAMAYA